MPTWRLILLSLLLSTLNLGCSEDSEPAPDSRTTEDSGTTADGGTRPDAGTAPEDGGTHTDAGTDPEDAGADAGPTDGAVHVRRFTRYRTASGIEERPEDFTRNPVELFVVDGNALVPMQGMAGGPGEYVFPDVPAVTYYLKVGTTYVVTDARSIDLSINKLGRADVQTLASDSTAFLALTGLDPWVPYPRSGAVLEHPGARLQLVSEEVGFATDILPDDVNDGSDAMEQEVLLSYASESMPRFEEARGDRARVVQLSPREFSGGTLPDGGTQDYLAAVRTLHLPPFSHDATETLPIRGTLEPLPMAELALNWKVSAFAAHAAEVNPAAALRSSTLDLHPTAHGLEEGWFGRSGSLVKLFRPLRLADDVVGTVSYGNPYPSTWGLLTQVATSFSIVGRDSAGGSHLITAGFTERRPVSPGATVALVPRIRPPRDLTLDGTEAYSSRTLATGTHVIGWQPPPAGSVDTYRVTLTRFHFLSDRVSYFADTTFHTDGDVTSVRLPEGILKPGNLYYVTVRAIVAEGYTPDKPLMVDNRPDYSDAAALSGLLSVPAQTP